MKAGILILISIIISAGLCGQSIVDEYLNYAIQFTESNQNEEAIRVCDKLVSIIPDNPDIYFLRGVNKYLIKDYDGAISDFDITLDIKPNHGEAFLFRARSKKGNRDYIGALKDYNNARINDFYETISNLAFDFMKSFWGDRSK